MSEAWIKGIVLASLSVVGFLMKKYMKKVDKHDDRIIVLEKDSAGAKTSDQYMAESIKTLSLTIKEQHKEDRELTMELISILRESKRD